MTGSEDSEALRRWRQDCRRRRPPGRSPEPSTTGLPRPSSDIGPTVRDWLHRAGDGTPNRSSAKSTGPPDDPTVDGCLASLDELIGAQERKLDALRRWRQGLVQHLRSSADG